MEKKGLNPKLLGALAAVAVVVVIALVVIFIRRGDDMTAIVVRLLHKEGEVHLQDENGQDKSMLEDMNLFSGYRLITGTDGLAKLQLDDTKLVTLNNSSQLGFEKEKKAIRLKLDEGQLYFNVQEKLAEDESMDIETSTMVVGIRGTSGYVNAKEQKILITDGKVEIHGTNDVTGGKNSITLYAGQKVTMILDNTKEGEESVIFTVEDATLEDLPDFALKEILDDSELAERVADTFDMEVATLLEEVEQIINGRNDSVTTETAPGEVEVNVEDTSENTSSDSNTTRQRTSTGNTTTGTTSATTGESTGTADNTASGATSSDENTNTQENTNSEENTNTEEETTASYKVSVSSSTTAGGTYSTDVTEAKEGDTVTITATANAGYKFTGWTVESGDVTLKDASSATTTFVMGKKAVKIKANFEAITYSVSVSADDSTHGRVSASKTSGIIGDSITLSASPEPGYTFKEWKVESGGVTVSSSVSESGEGSGSFTIGSSNVKITAVFELKKYAVSVQLDNASYGVVSIVSEGKELASTSASQSSATANVTMGTVLTIKITPTYYCDLETAKLPEGFSEPVVNETITGYIYECNYTVTNADYSATIPIVLKEVLSSRVMLDNSIEGRREDVFLTYAYGNYPFYFYIDTETYCIKNLPCISCADGLFLELATLEDESTPVYVENNGQKTYFTLLEKDGRTFYYIDFGEGYICKEGQDSTSDMPVYEASSDHLYLIYEPGANFDWVLSNQAPGYY